jgi:hypothetical protein
VVDTPVLVPAPVEAAADAEVADVETVVAVAVAVAVVVEVTVAVVVVVELAVEPLVPPVAPDELPLPPGVVEEHAIAKARQPKDTRRERVMCMGIRPEAPEKWKRDRARGCQSRSTRVGSSKLQRAARFSASVRTSTIIFSTFALKAPLVMPSGAIPLSFAMSW